MALKRPRKPRQLEMALHTWGGARKGAGRKPKGRRAGVPHRSRAPLDGKNHPVHLTMRMAEHVWNLRSQRCLAVLRPAFRKGGDRFGFRLIHYSIQGNHIHFLVEAAHVLALKRGAKGLAVRIAKALNRVMGKRGQVIADRYHTHTLRTPREARNALAYLRNNAGHHYGPRPAGPDPFASIVPVTEPATGLLRGGAPTGAGSRGAWS